MYKLRRGDIIRNGWAGEKNPNRDLMFLRKASIKQGRYTHPTYECLAYDGKHIHIFRSDSRIEVIGHMEEFDNFMDALKALKGAKL